MQKTLLALILPLLLVGCKQNVSEQEISSEDTLAISKYEMSDTGKDKLNQNAEDIAEKEFCESKWVGDKFKSDRYTHCRLLSKEKNLAAIAVEKLKDYTKDGDIYQYLDVDIYLLDYKKRQVLDHYYDKKSIITDVNEVGIGGIYKIKNFESAFILNIGESRRSRYPTYSIEKADIYMYTSDFKIKKISEGLRFFSGISQSYERGELKESCIGASYELKADIQALNSQSNGLPDIQVTYAEKASEYDTCDWQTARNYPNDTIVLKFDGKQYIIPNQPKYKYDEEYDDYKYYWDYVNKYDLV